MTHAIRQAVEYRGGYCWHPRDSRGQALTDMPDLVIVLPAKRLIGLVELKSQPRIVTEGQRIALAKIAECDHLWSGIVRPQPKDGEFGYDAFLSYLEG